MGGFRAGRAALLVSVISLTVAILHGRTMEQIPDANARLVEANSWPFVGEILSRDDRSVVIGATNSGVGPAKIHWAEVAYDGRPVADFRALMQACCGYDGSAGKLHYGFGVLDGTVLRPGERTQLVSLVRDKNPALHQALFRALLKVQVKTCYCSVFDDCFIGDGQSLDPQRVKTCGAAPHPFDPLG